MHSPGSTTAGGAAARAAASPRHQRMISSVMADTLNPTSATAKDTSGAPPDVGQRQQRAFGLGEPTTPHGNPPNGTVDLSHSWADHSPANHSGQPGSRRTSTADSANSAGNSASSTLSSSHGSAPTSPLIHGSNGR